MTKGHQRRIVKLPDVLPPQDREKIHTERKRIRLHSGRRGNPLDPRPPENPRVLENGVLPLPRSWMELNGHPSSVGFNYRRDTLIVTTEDDRQDRAPVRYVEGMPTVHLPAHWYRHYQRVSVAVVGANLEVTGLD